MLRNQDYGSGIYKHLLIITFVKQFIQIQHSSCVRNYCPQDGKSQKNHLGKNINSIHQI